MQNDYKIQCQTECETYFAMNIHGIRKTILITKSIIKIQYEHKETIRNQEKYVHCTVIKLQNLMDGFSG